MVSKKNSKDMELILTELSELRKQNYATNVSIIEMKAEFKQYFTQQEKTERALLELDADVKRKYDPIHTKIENWKGGLNILIASSVLVPAIFVGALFALNPNNGRIDKIEDKINVHVSDPELHHNILTKMRYVYISREEFDLYRASLK